jgi:4-nitrophenyl phosphatase/NagD protein/phosphoglycolate phosphatase
MVMGSALLLESIKKKSLFVLDLDGVLYLENAMIPGADKAVSLLRDKGYQVAFLTNNSGKKSSTVHAKLNRLGIPCHAGEVFTSADSAIYYIKKQDLGGRGVFAVGSGELKSGIVEAGLTLAPPETCGCILVGFKKDMTYEDASAAILALRRDVPFIICNRDPYFPCAEGKLLPGCGYTVGAIEGSSTRTADVHAGKPAPMVLDMICDAFDVEQEDIALVGDLLDADVALAERAGIPIVYVGHEEFEQKDYVLHSDSLYTFVSDYVL